MNIGKILWRSREQGHSTKSRWVREYIRKKYQDTCVMCGRRYRRNINSRRYFSNIHIDHIIPFAHGGRNNISNYQLLCSECNLQKSDTLII